MVDGVLPQVQYERELMVGSVGTLWLGRLIAGSEAGRTVLLRRISLDLLTPRDVDSLSQIAEAYAKVRHPSLVKLLGIVEQDRDLISVSEHLDGVRLSDLMRSAIDTGMPLPATVALRIVLDAARATVKAHRLAGDLGLYPADRLFVSEGVFVAAFGGTLLTEIGVLAALTRCSQPRSIPDVLAQLAPEELDKSVSGSGSPEVFSLGVLLWEALANRSLFSRDSAGQTMNEVLNLPIEPLDRIERCGMPVPDALAEVVTRATQRNPNHRYATLEQLVNAIEQLPAHFIATEHHVASALRNQAATLLQAFHVDRAQASLTMAFSEVPASRLSTRPPPDGHDWDPPTFNQSSLVSNGPRTLQVSHAPALATESLRGAVPVSSAIPELGSRKAHRRRALRIGLTLAIVSSSLLLWVAARSRSSNTAIAPETSRIGGTLTAGPAATPTAVLPSAVAPEPSASTATPFAPQASVSNALRQTPRGDPNEPSQLVQPESEASSAAAKRSGTTYRPRQIAPYRPKGI